MRKETIIMKRALHQIDTAPWEEDENGTLNFYTEDSDRRLIHCWLTLLPPWCDLGHIQLNIEGLNHLDAGPKFPRYFFSFEEANNHCRTFLKWRLWKHRTHSPGWGKFHETQVNLHQNTPETAAQAGV